MATNVILDNEYKESAQHFRTADLSFYLYCITGILPIC